MANTKRTIAYHIAEYDNNYIVIPGVKSAVYNVVKFSGAHPSKQDKLQSIINHLHEKHRSNLDHKGALRIFIHLDNYDDDTFFFRALKNSNVLLYNNDGITKITDNKIRAKKRAKNMHIDMKSYFSYVDYLHRNFTIYQGLDENATVIHTDSSITSDNITMSINKSGDNKVYSFTIPLSSLREEHVKMNVFFAELLSVYVASCMFSGDNTIIYNDNLYVSESIMDNLQFHDDLVDFMIKKIRQKNIEVRHVKGHYVNYDNRVVDMTNSFINRTMKHFVSTKDGDIVMPANKYRSYKSAINKPPFAMVAYKGFISPDVQFKKVGHLSNLMSLHNAKKQETSHSSAM